MFSYSQWLDELIKAAGHKYIKRVPYQSGGKMRYRYIYNATHTHGGKHVLDPDHMQVGTKLMLDATSGAEVHGHIQSVSGDKVTFVYDDGPKKGESVTMSKEKLASELDKVHGISGKLDAARKKQSDIVAKLKEKGASAKQIARAEARLKALGGDTPKGSKDQTAEQKRAAHALSLAITEARKPRAEYKPKFSYSEEEYAVVNKLRDYAATQQGTARKMAIDFADRYKEAVTSHKRAMRSKPGAERVMLIPQMREAEMSLLDEMEQQLLSRQNATVQEQVTIAQPLGTSETEAQESLQTRAQVVEGLRRAVAQRVPPIEVKKNGKIKKEPTQDHIETRMFFGAALRNLSGVGAMALGNQLQTKESMRHVAEIYKTTHTKGTDFEEAKNAAFMPILEHVISELEGFDRDTWFGDDLEGREQLERRLDTLKKIKAGEREQ